MRLKTESLQARLPKPLRRYLSRFDNPLVGSLFTLTQSHYHCEGLRIAYPKGLVDIGFRSMFFFDLFEESERELLRDRIRPDDRVLEVGACLGVVSCLIDRQLGEEGRLVVVEANPRIIPVLRQNRDENGAGFAIEACAIGDGEEREFAFGDSIVTGRVPTGATGERSVETTPVPTRTLADLEEEHGPFNVLVADIEGGELELLESNPECLRRLRMVLVELHPGTIGEDGAGQCRKALTEAGLLLEATEGDTELWLRP